MAEDGKKTQPKGLTEKPPEIHEVTIPEKKEKVAREQGQKRGDIALDLRGRQSHTAIETAESRYKRLEEEIKTSGRDVETAKIIEEIDPFKESTEQQQAIEKLQLVTYVLLAQLFNRGIKKDDPIVKNFSIENLKYIEEKLKNPPLEAHYKDLAKKVFTKYHQIAGANGSPLLEKLQSNQASEEYAFQWQKIVETAYSHYQEAAGTKAALEKKDAEDEKGERQKTQSSPWYGDLWRWIKENPKAAILIGVGVYAAFNYFFNSADEEKGKEKGLLEKIGLGSWKSKFAVGGVVLGALIGPDNFTKWFDDINPLKKAEKLAENGLTWLEEKINFTGIKEKVSEYLPEGVKNISLAEIAQDLGIKKEDEKTWLEYTVEGGAALLLYKWFNKKERGSVSKFIGMNAGLYLFIIREGKNSFAGKILSEAAGLIDFAKDKIVAGLKHIPGTELLISDAFENFKLEDNIDDLMEYMKENPLESMAAINGFWLCRGILWKVITGFFKTGGKVFKYAWNNKGKAALASGVLTGLYLGRKTFIKDFIKVAYEDPNSKEAQEMLTSLDRISEIDRSKGDTLAEAQASSFIKSITEDPINALKKAENIDLFNQGAFAIAVDATGMLMLVAKGVSVPIQLSKLSWESFKSIEHIYSPEFEGNCLISTIVAGVEVLVFGSMAWEGFKAYKTVLKLEKSGWKNFYRGLKSLMPGTKEWNFIVKSSFTGVPGVTLFLKKLESRGANRVQQELRKILKLAQEAQPDFEKIRKISEGLLTDETFLDRDLAAIKKNLSGTNFGYQTAKKVEDVKSSIASINDSAKKPKDATSLENIKTLAKDADQRLEGIKTNTRHMLERAKLIFQGKFKEAISLESSAKDLQVSQEEVAKPIDIKKSDIFKKADGSFKTETELGDQAETLKKEISAMTDTDIGKKAKIKELHAIEAYLDPIAARKGFKIDPGEIAKLDESGKAAKIETLAAELEAVEKGTQAKFNAEVEKIVKEAKVKKIPLSAPEVTAKLEQLDKDLIIPFAQQKQGAIKNLVAEYKKIPGKLKTASLKAQITHAIEGVDGTLMTRVAKGAKGRAKMMVVMAALMFTTDQIIHRNDPERELVQMLEELGPEFGQLMLDVLPIVGTFSNFYSAFSGREYISKKDVSGTWDRTSNVIWGCVGLAGDVITVIGAIPTGGGDIAANVALRLTKQANAGSKVAIKTLKMWPRIERIADQMGGWLKFSQKLKEYMKEGTAIGKGLRKIETVGTIAGTAMLVGGTAYHMRYAFIDTNTEIDIPEDLKSDSLISTLPEAA